jgi:hypothetical protein
MPRLLEELTPGTPVRTGDGALAGEVRAVYASGQARGAEYLLIFWNARNEEALIDADEVLNIAADGAVELRCTSYPELPAFDPAANPLLHRL